MSCDVLSRSPSTFSDVKLVQVEPYAAVLHDPYARRRGSEDGNERASGRAGGWGEEKYGAAGKVELGRRETLRWVPTVIIQSKVWGKNVQKNAHS